MSEQHVYDQVMKAQGFAIEIEHILSNIFECDRLGFGGQINSEQIREHPFLSMTQGLAFLYALYPQKRKAYDSFIERFSFYEEMSLDELLSFDTNEKVINSKTIQIEKENGLEQIQYMISEFRKIIE